MKRVFCFVLFSSVFFLDTISFLFFFFVFNEQTFDVFPSPENPPFFLAAIMDAGRFVCFVDFFSYLDRVYDTRLD